MADKLKKFNLKEDDYVAYDKKNKFKKHKKHKTKQPPLIYDDEFVKNTFDKNFNKY